MIVVQEYLDRIDNECYHHLLSSEDITKKMLTWNDRVKSFDQCVIAEKEKIEPNYVQKADTVWEQCNVNISTILDDKNKFMSIIDRYAENLKGRELVYEIPFTPLPERPPIPILPTRRFFTREAAESAITRYVDPAERNRYLMSQKVLEAQELELLKKRALQIPEVQEEVQQVLRESFGEVKKDIQSDKPVISEHLKEPLYWKDIGARMRERLEEQNLRTITENERVIATEAFAALIKYVKKEQSGKELNALDKFMKQKALDKLSQIRSNEEGYD